MSPRARSITNWSPYGLNRRVLVPGGCEYLNFPSMLARRVLYYPLSVGDVHWPQGAHNVHPNPSCPFHDDRGFLFHFVLTGALTHCAGKQTFVATRHETVLLNLRQPVAYHNAGTPPVHLLWVWFDGIGLAEIAAELRAAEEPIFRGLDRVTVQGLARELRATMEREPPGYEAKLSALLGALVAELCRVRPPPSRLGADRPPAALSPSIRKAVTTIARRYAKRWTIKELSQVSGLSMYYFFRTFRKEMGCSPMQYLNRYRVEQAKMLLASTKMPVQEIAGQAGLPNRQHFASVFREVAGVSPRQYRARNLPSSANAIPHSST